MTQPDPSLSPPRSAVEKTPTRFEKTIHGGNCGTTPFYLYSWQRSPEYDQGDCVIVWYDDLYDLAQKAMASSSPSRERGEAGKLTHYSPSPSTAGRPTMFVDPEGDYVRTADVEALLSALPLSVEPKQEPAK